MVQLMNVKYAHLAPGSELTTLSKPFYKCYTTFWYMHNYFLYKPWIVWALTESAKIPAKWRIASGSGETGWSCSEFGFRLCVDSRICRAKATRLFGSRQSRSDNIWPDSEMARIGFLSEVDFWSRPRQVCKMVRSATCVNKKYNFF